MHILRKAQTAASIYNSSGVWGLLSTIKRKYEGRSKRRDLKLIHSHTTLAERFSAIERLNYWKSPHNSESVSGVGSTKQRASQYLNELESFVRARAVHIGRPVKFFDAPCGDLNWMEDIAISQYVEYHGADIVPVIVSRNQNKYQDRDMEFSIFDITSDVFPSADIWHCRDCLFHLSFRNIFKSLRNFGNSEIPFALLTSHVMDDEFRNYDIEDGDFRFLDLTKYPFWFPEPDVVLNDGGGSGEPVRIVGLYSRETVNGVLAARSEE